MGLILFHSGVEMPAHVEFMLQQFRYWNPEEKIFFLTSRDFRNIDYFKKYRISFINKELLKTKRVDKFIKVFKRKEDDFWTVTATRFFYISECMRVFGIQNVIHTENDVLIYHPIGQFMPIYKTLFPYMSITPGGPDKCMTGWMYINNYMALDDMLNYWTNLLSLYSLKEIKKKFELDMVSEMSLLRIYMNNTNRLRPLPILPFGDHCDSLVYFKSIFDPASYGQFVGGTRDGIPGAKPKDHYIGQYLLKNPMSHVVFRMEDNRRIPYLQWSVDNYIRINNLHIHSKQLHKYLSYD